MQRASCPVTRKTHFEHKDTVTEHSRTIDFTNKQALGTNVVFHTTVPVKNGEVTVYKVDANGRTRIVKTVSNAGGQVCFRLPRQQPMYWNTDLR
ncbi:MAG: hypothetical protein ACLU2W_14040 [Waltera sp.]|uniref:hypothetical protein n=1 Tax=Waltera sp. TaxID=2815806 RepID=UPI00399AC919